MLPVRNIAFVVGLAVGLLCLTPGVHAEVFPNKPVRFIVPVPAGSSADVAARAVGQRLATLWGQAVIVDNRPGGGTIVGTRAIALAPPDGYTFGWVIAAHSINPSLYPKLPYDTVRDFSGVTLIYQLRVVIVAPVNLPANSINELVALVKKQPDFLYTSPAIGSGPHLLGELFRLQHGLSMRHVGYKSAATAHTDVVAGRIPLMFDTLPSALPLIQSDKLKVIAIVSDKPVPGFAQYPTLSGLLPADATTGWNGIVVPARTPGEKVKKLNHDIVAAIRSPEVQAVFRTLTVETVTSTPEQFDAFIRDEIVRWGNVVKRAGITLEGE